MTLSEIKAMLDESGFPVAFHHFETKQTLPFIVYVTPNSNNISADGKVILSVNVINVELYTDKKDPDAEKKLERIFYNYGIVWEKSQQWFSDEKIYETIYEFSMEE